MFQPVRLFDTGEPSRFVDVGVTELLQFPERFPHDVYVVDVEEDEFSVLVGVLGFVAAAFRLVGDGVRARPRVHDEHLVALCVRVHYQLDVVFVFSTSFTTNLK